MKICITFKNPDAVDYALEDIPREEREEVKEKLSKWITYNEYVTIEFDLDNNTAEVCFE